MSLTPSTMVPLGTQAPDFALEATDGSTVSLSELDNGKPLLMMFICNHCPFVVHVREELVNLAKAYQERGVSVVGVCSNSIETHPDDGPEKMAATAKEFGFTFPYLYDASQAVAKAYRAACTPDFFVYDRDHVLAYRGQLDDSRPDNGKPVTGADLRAALDAILAREPASAEQTPSAGCNIKWKPGNEPDYA